MKTCRFWIAIVSFCLFSAAHAQAQTSGTFDSHLPFSRVKFFQKLNSATVEIVDEKNPLFQEKLGDYPWAAKVVQSDIFKWDPLGVPRTYFGECDSFEWRKKTLTENSGTSATAKLESSPVDSIISYLQRCEGEWKTGWNDLFTNGLGMLSFKLHPNTYPFGRHVILHLPNNIRVKGLLAMKTDGKKRPLVILRTGLFSNTQEFYPERFLFFQLFEQSPFHVLVLESSSGSEFLSHNRNWSLGGFDEGLQNFWIAKNLQDPSEPISKFIHSVHMAGLSLGGHGVMFSALLNEFNRTDPSEGLPLGKTVLQSSLALCPLLNMQETLDYHLSQGFSMDLMNYWASRRLKILFEWIPGIRSDHFVQDFFAWIQKNYQGPLIADPSQWQDGEIAGLRLPAEVLALLRRNPKPEDLFWQLNHYWPWFQKVRTPVLILSTEKDPIVSWFINTGRLQGGRLNLRESNVKQFSFKEGFHCSLPIAYDWAAVANVVQTYILQQSPGFHLATREVKVPMEAKVLEKITKDAHLNLKFEVFQQTSGVFVTVKFNSKANPDWWEEFLAPTMTAKLPLSDMEFPVETLIRGEDEASLLRRWAYQNITARLSGGDVVFSWPVTAP